MYALPPLVDRWKWNGCGVSPGVAWGLSLLEQIFQTIDEVLAARVAQDYVAPFDGLGNDMTTGAGASMHACWGTDGKFQEG